MINTIQNDLSSCYNIPPLNSCGLTITSDNSLTSPTFLRHLLTKIQQDPHNKVVLFLHQNRPRGLQTTHCLLQSEKVTKPLSLSKHVQTTGTLCLVCDLHSCIIHYQYMHIIQYTYCNTRLGDMTYYTVESLQSPNQVLTLAIPLT